MAANQNYYDILGVSNSASTAEIRNAYRNLAQQYHPDKHDDNPLSELAAEKFREIHEAYEVLSNPAKRRQYDEKRGTSSSGNSSTPSGISEVYSLIDRRLYAEAHNVIDRLISNNYNDPGLHAVKALVYVEQENNFSAVGSFETAMGLGLEDADSFFVYGIALIDTKRYEDAIKIIQKALDIRGEVPNYLANMAIAYELDGQKERGKTIWKRLENIDPGNPILAQRKQVWSVGGTYVGKQDAKNKACWACIILECLFDCC